MSNAACISGTLVPGSPVKGRPRRGRHDARRPVARRHVRSARHAIQVDFLRYLSEIRKERRVRAKRGRSAPPASQAS
jgi:hypothetical protein